MKVHAFFASTALIATATVINSTPISVCNDATYSLLPLDGITLKCSGPATTGNNDYACSNVLGQLRLAIMIMLAHSRNCRNTRLPCWFTVLESYSQIMQCT